MFSGVHLTAAIGAASCQQVKGRFIRTYFIRLKGMHRLRNRTLGSKTREKRKKKSCKNWNGDDIKLRSSLNLPTFLEL